MGIVRKFSLTLVATSRCDVPARETAGGIVAPLNAVRTAQRAVPTIPPRDPPIRFRKSVPDCWIGLELIEGKNRQVRRMTAAIGHPTLRLVRVRIGNFRLGDLPPGQWRMLTDEECQSVQTSGE